MVDETETRVERVAENSYLKLGGRIGIPILLALLAWMFQELHSEIKSINQVSLPELHSRQWQMNTNVKQLETKVDGLKEQVQGKIDHLDTKITENDASLERHERSIVDLWQRKMNRSE